MVDAATMMVLDAADLLEVGITPNGRGWLDEPKSLIDAIGAANADKSRWLNRSTEKPDG